MTPFRVKLLTVLTVLLTLYAAHDLANAQTAPQTGAVAASRPAAAPARDGNVAIREELDAARQAGTRAAYDLFIARHPNHPLKAVAEGERTRLPAGR